jgi:hypothetical protein
MRSAAVCLTQDAGSSNEGPLPFFFGISGPDKLGSENVLKDRNSESVLDHHTVPNMPPRQPGVGAGQYGDGLVSVVDAVRKEGMKAKGPKKERPKKKKIYKCVAAVLLRPHDVICK